MAKRNCKICQTRYDYCPHCNSDKDKPNWMMLFHDDNCFKIFDTLQKHSTKEYTDKQAIQIFQECDLSALDNATESIQKQVSEIMSKKEKTTVKTTTAKKTVSKTSKEEPKEK